MSSDEHGDSFASLRYSTSSFYDIKEDGWHLQLVHFLFLAVVDGD